MIPILTLAHKFNIVGWRARFGPLEYFRTRTCWICGPNLMYEWLDFAGETLRFFL
ncbi:hypothetical protein ACS0TY_036684 [Phlomoides rotata]